MDNCRIAITIPQKTRKALESEAKKAQLTKSVIIRMALEEYLNRKEVAKKA